MITEFTNLLFVRKDKSQCQSAQQKKDWSFVQKERRLDHGAVSVRKVTHWEKWGVKRRFQRGGGCHPLATEE